MLESEQTSDEIQRRLGIHDRKHIRLCYITPALSAGLIERTIPDKPTSRFQKYRITAKGRAALVSRTAKEWLQPLLI